MTRFITLIQILCVLVLGAFARSCPGAEAEFVISGEQLQAVPEKSLRLLIILSNVDLLLDADADSETAVSASIIYDDSDPEPTLVLEEEGESAFRAVFSSGSAGARQQWHISLGRHMPKTLLTIEGRSLDGRAQMGGLPLRTCTLFMQEASDLQIGFDRSAPVPLELFMITGTNFDLSVDGLGSSDVETLGLMCRASSVALDVSGAFPTPVPIRQFTMLAASSTLDIVLPQDVGCLISAKALLSAFDVSGSGWDQQLNLPLWKRYRTAEFAAQDAQLYVNCTAIRSEIRLQR